MNADDWRVEVELDDDEHGYSLGERLRALDLDDEARKRLGGRVIVTRDGSKLFLYTRTREEADEAVRVVRELLSADRLSAEVRTTRWHAEAEAWEEPAGPARPPETGGHGWRVQVRAADRGQAAALEESLGREGVHVERRWSYLSVDARTEDEAQELLARVRAQAPGAEVELDASADVPDPLFVLVRSWF